MLDHLGNFRQTNRRQAPAHGAVLPIHTTGAAIFTNIAASAPVAAYVTRLQAG